MRIDIVTIFPDMLKACLDESIIRRAVGIQLVEINIIDLRDYSVLKHRKVDDTPYGGGAGMLMQFPPFYHAIKALKNDNSTVIITSPRGQVFNQKTAERYASLDHLIILAGHYEGIDERVYHFIDEEVSMGDFVLTGGELPAMMITDAVVRLLDDVIKKESHENDSFSMGLLEHPHYTKPATYEGYEVPEVLRNGNHQEIAKWRRYEALKQTLQKRPDLLEKATLTKDDLKMLEAIKNELSKDSK
jgi:tRNA (guanine37-N1)-methyltransferase